MVANRGCYTHDSFAHINWRLPHYHATMLILVKSPLTSDYGAFLSQCIREFVHDDVGVQVIIGDPITQSQHLNYVLLTLYTQVRALLVSRGFGPNTQVDVYFNLQLWRLKAWKPSAVFLEALETVPQEFSGARLFKISSAPTPRDLAGYFASRAATEELNSEGGSYDQYSFHTVAVGGTFDHLHDGHKILLSMASFVTKSRLIVGVTGQELLKNKKYALMLQTLEHRINVVCRYLEDMLQNHQSYIIYQINDICGPTGYIADVEALVISEETLQGAKFVNEYRLKANMPVLAVITAKVLGGDGNADNNWQGKLSSTDLRKAEYESQHLEA